MTPDIKEGFVSPHVQPNLDATGPAPIVLGSYKRGAQARSLKLFCDAAQRWPDYTKLARLTSRVAAILLFWACLSGAAWAAIVSSQIVEDAPQIDGRRHVTERHTDHTGAIHEIRYMAEAAANVQTVMAARVAQIEINLADSEIQRHLSNAVPGYAITLQHATLAQVRTALREKFRTASAWELTTLGAYIHSLSLTDPQLTNLFGVSGAQLTALKTKLLNCFNRYNAVVAEAGQ